VPGRVTAVWRTTDETLRLSGVTGSPLRMLLTAEHGLPSAGEAEPFSFLLPRRASDSAAEVPHA